MRLTISTYNVHYILTPAQTLSDLGNLLRSNLPDVLCLQEFGSPERIPVLEKLSKSFRYEYYRPNDFPAQRQTPIMWGEEWQVMQSGAHRLNVAREVEPGSGGTSLESKWAVWVILQNRKNDKRIGVINWHAPGSVENPANVQRRRAMGECTRSVRLLTRNLKREVEYVFIAGDMNVNYRKRAVRKYYSFPVLQFKNEGLSPNWRFPLPTKGTHTPYGYTNGRRVIDYIFSNVAAKRTRILEGYKSDHKPVLVVYEL